MKKFLFLCVLVAIAIALISCEQKEPEMLGEYELSEHNGLLGLKLNGSTVLEPLYDEISMSDEYPCVMAKKSGETTLVVGEHVAFTGVVDSVKVAETDGYFVISTPEGKYLWKGGTNDVLGHFNDIAMDNDIVFFKSDEGWGAAFLNHTPIAPRRFEKVYVAKNKDTHAVLVYDKKNGWSMHDKGGFTEGRKYDTSSKVLEKQLKKFDISRPYGVLEVDWKL